MRGASTSSMIPSAWDSGFSGAHIQPPDQERGPAQDGRLLGHDHRQAVVGRRHGAREAGGAPADHEEIARTVLARPSAVIAVLPPDSVRRVSHLGAPGSTPFRCPGFRGAVAARRGSEPDCRGGDDRAGRFHGGRQDDGRAHPGRAPGDAVRRQRRVHRAATRPHHRRRVRRRGRAALPRTRAPGDQRTGPRVRTPSWRSAGAPSRIRAPGRSCATRPWCTCGSATTRP